MNSLFIDTTGKYLTLILESNNIVLGHYHLDGERKHTELTVPTIKKLLDEQHLKLKDLTALYLTMGPGSYTGIRVPITIAKILKTINPDFKVYTINSLLYQAGLDNCISMIDAKGGQFYFAIYQNGQEIIPIQLLTLENCREISQQFSGYEIREDLLEFDYLNNYLNLKPYFILNETVDDLIPLYFKKAVESNETNR
ncbi:tRNA (adenosine(37)-N6)-threonylcarbamoyltransferase complex dimerization subunit type 1 TsaB [Spiroplasma chrysopicola]|uniref:Glycoprotease n=1 Tax=Spiroplasma chrysopicola DF-1 TaxID=1276227 RepID=R4UGL8_9MOLU|nr:tRNA (adenosine(37)-N6)-threonylcarbamoyltransferase complex dimerization subunit type 1 TsaB [Spiroplasma chrysopicola]AGM25275.1 glycoprotease [Spiroplasma chrysopicola DF-1]